MTITAFFFAFMMAIVSFYVNQRIHKMTNIKITINSFFDLFADENSFDEFGHEDAAKRIMDEIISIEKVIDVNFYVDLELRKLRGLRMVHVNFQNKVDAMEQIGNIGFKRLNRSFIILSFFNIELPYYEAFKEKKQFKI